MFKFIQHQLKTLMMLICAPSQEDAIYQQYKLLEQKIVESNTLAQLFNSRARLIEYNEVVKQIGSPVWAKNSVKILEATWNRKYRLWKARG